MNVRTYDQDLSDYLLLLWSRLRLIAACTVGGILLAAVGTSFMPKSYEATATLMVIGSKLPVTPGEAPRTDVRLNTDMYVELIRSRAAATRVIQDLKLEPYDITPDLLARSISVRAVSTTPLLRVSLRLGDPELAARVINEQVKRAIEMNRALAIADLTETRQYLREQVSAAGDELGRRENELREVQTKNRFQETTEMLKGLLKQRADLKASLDEAEQNVAKFQASSKSLEEALSTQQKTLTLIRSVARDSALKDVIAQQAQKTQADVLNLQMRSEELNPAYADTEPEYIKAKAAYAGAVAQRDALRQQVTATARTTEQLERDLAVSSQQQLAGLREVELAKNAYEAFTKSYETARLSVAAQSSELKLFDLAVPREAPVAPNRTVNMLIAGIASLILSIFAVVFMNYMQAARRTSRMAVESHAPVDPPISLRSSR